MPDLTFKQRLFVAAYLGDANGNGTEAARIAGYAEPAVQAHENLTKPNIRAAIDARVSEACLPVDEVLSRLSEHATADMADFIDIAEDGGVVLNLRKAADKLHLIKKLTLTKYGVAIELHDAQAALVHIGRYYGLFAGRTSHELGDLTDDQLLDRIRGIISEEGMAQT